MKRLIDLTHTFTGADMPVYPGDPCVRLYATTSVATDGVCLHQLDTGLHVGTHIDAPMHMIEGGAAISAIPLEKCTGMGHLVDARGRAVIAVDLLAGLDLQPGDIVLVWTGWSDKFRDPEYYTSHPVLDDSFATMLAARRVAMVVLDLPSPDREPFAIHKILLAADVLIAENATNLAALPDRNFTIHAWPAKLEAEAAPARIVAELR